MRLHNYLTEYTDNNLYVGLNQNCQEFKKSCDINKDISTHTLYSGRNHDIETYIVKVPRSDRKPKDMQPYLHEILNNVFEEIFGWKARSEGLFVTTQISIANSYGQPYIIVPFDGFKFIWSAKISDLYNSVRRDGTIVNLYSKKEKLTNYIKEIIKKNYKDSDLGSAMRSKHEIMLKCTKYYMIDMSMYKVYKAWLNG